ncbi:MAG: hypothetical protein RSB50_06375 [Cetobacterium sp.]
MAKIKKVANGEYIGANKYTIKDAGGGKSTVDFAPDSVLTPGTEVGAELLNEMQLNALYTLDTNRVIEGQKEVYVANLEGFTDFTKPDLSFYLKINTNNTNAQTYLRLDATDYLIKCKVNDLVKNSIVACRKVGSEIVVLSNYIQRQDDAIWGGPDGGGLIEDPSITKEIGKRYIGADGKAYICLVPSNINNKDNYMPCNVVDNLDKLQNLTRTFYLNNDTLVLRINIIKNLCFFNFAISAESGPNANFRFDSNQILFDLSSFGIAFSDSFEVAIGRIYNPTVGAEIAFRVRFDKGTNRIISKVAGFNGYSESFGNYAISLK